MFDTNIQYSSHMSGDRYKHINSGSRPDEKPCTVYNADTVNTHTLKHYLVQG